MRKKKFENCNIRNRQEGFIYAEVVTFVAGSLEAGGLPGSLEIPEVLK
jgi:hypothetical protein